MPSRSRRPASTSRRACHSHMHRIAAQGVMSYIVSTLPSMRRGGPSSSSDPYSLIVLSMSPRRLLLARNPGRSWQGDLWARTSLLSFLRGIRFVRHRRVEAVGWQGRCDLSLSRHEIAQMYRSGLRKLLRQEAGRGGRRWTFCTLGISSRFRRQLRSCVVDEDIVSVGQMQDDSQPYQAGPLSSYSSPEHPPTPARSIPPRPLASPSRPIHLLLQSPFHPRHHLSDLPNRVRSCPPSPADSRARSWPFPRGPTSRESAVFHTDMRDEACSATSHRHPSAVARDAGE
jgi:hypothetical protein